MALAFETTATSISAVLFYLAHSATAYSRLAHEIRSTFTDLEEIVSGPMLNSCKYLSACIQEALRMSPAVPGAMWREAEPGGITVAGEYIPAGYDVGCCIYAMHHNEVYFQDSFRFFPDRWLCDNPPDNSSAAHTVYSPFSFGPRSCIGRAFAMTEIAITLARVMWLMDFRLSETEIKNLDKGKRYKAEARNRIGEYQLYSHLTSYSQGPFLEFRARGI